MQCKHMWDPIVILPEYVAMYMYVISQYLYAGCLIVAMCNGQKMLHWHTTE